MAKELVIASNRHETKLALLEEDQLVEVYFQRSNEYSLAGSIHKGRVTRVLPGMQSAFVDLGLERDCFLYVSDFFEENEEYDRLAEERGPRAERAEPVAAPPAERPVPVVAVADAAAAAPAERPAERPEDPQERERRGRRSRRRRNRGRGFPDSKYASAEAPPRAEEPEIETAAAGEEFPVLPGESLAKYRRPEAGREDPPEELGDAAAALVEAVESGDMDAEPEGFAAPVEPVEELEEPAGIAESEPPAEEPEPGPEDPEPVAEEPAPDPGEFEPVAEEPETAVPGEAPEQAAAGAEGVEPARVPQSLTATLREQGGGRFLHRTSRRMRRKTRGGGPPEAERREGERHEGEPRAEAAPRPEPRIAAPRAERPAQPSISELLKEGQEILVQVAKEPLGQKGARITSHIALPGRYCVYMPTVDHMGVSRKIASDEERQRLRRILQAHRAGTTGGFIVRTAGEGHTEDEIAQDMSYLFNLWMDIRQKAEKRRAPALIHHDLEIVQRILRDQLNETFKAIWVDSEELYESMLHYVERFQPALVSRVKMYTRPTPIFDAFNITAELEKALRPKVWLKSGGYIVINQTEALVAIDVNTGKFVGRSNRLEDTIVKTNTEAVKEIARQMRLRDLGGIIVVDFIDMDERKNRQKVMQALEEAMHPDRAPYKILQFNDFGLVAITRKRVKQSLERTLCAPCPYCEGAGYVKSVQTVIGDIVQEAHKIARAVADSGSAMLRVNPEVAKVLKSTQNRHLEELEEILGCPVLVTGDPNLHQEKFDLS
ncbi:MAG: Rne/Rng family ribonuclease [Acidobacteria bacterium]|nr:Rne/Rng family ribonuclease [Acidobacteriota bacterium]